MKYQNPTRSGRFVHFDMSVQNNMVFGAGTIKLDLVASWHPFSMRYFQKLGSFVLVDDLDRTGSRNGLYTQSHLVYTQLCGETFGLFAELLINPCIDSLCTFYIAFVVTFHIVEKPEPHVFAWSAFLICTSCLVLSSRAL